MRLEFLGIVVLFSRKAQNNTKPAPASLPIVVDLDPGEWVLTLQFLEDLKDVYVEIMDETGELIYYETLDGDISEDFSILLTYEKVGEYLLSIICKDKPAYIKEFEIY